MADDDGSGEGEGCEGAGSSSDQVPSLLVVTRDDPSISHLQEVERVTRRVQEAYAASVHRGLSILAGLDQLAPEQARRKEFSSIVRDCFTLASPRKPS